MRARAIALTVGPALVALIIAFVLPLVSMLIMSFSSGRLAISELDNLLTELTLEHYNTVLRDSFFLTAFGRTVGLSLLVVALSALLAYPVCMHMRWSRGLTRTIVVMLALGPLLISVVVRSFGWIILLGPGGVVADAFGVTLLHTDTAIVVGLVHLYFVFMVLSLMAVISSIPGEMINAARTLGTDAWGTFRRVILPMSLPGLIAGCVIVFGSCSGAIVTPLFLGGSQAHLAASELYRQISIYGDWPIGSAMAVILLLINVIVIVLLQRGLASYLGRGWLSARVTQ